ncbi:hypothetical protein [Streptomyces sp. cg35]|uniref:hypothetical protein n=1 Tax=Streptomyces sp. cg35 TaxID=3421650 RepID=UPI003D174C25
MNQLCASDSFRLDARGDMQIKAPAKQEWPYQDELANANGLNLDVNRGLWVPIQHGTVIERPVERLVQQRTVRPGVPVDAWFQGIPLANPTVTPLRVELSLMFKAYVYLYKGVGSLESKWWIKGEEEPGFDEVATVYSEGFTWMRSWVMDAGFWLQPGEEKTVWFGARYRIAEKSDQHIVRYIESHPVGFTFPAYPLQDQFGHDITPPEPDYDVWVQDMGAVAGENVSDDQAKANVLAFQAAVDAIVADGNRGRVRVPDGVFLLKGRSESYNEPMIQLKDAVHILMDDDAVLRRRGRGYLMGNWAYGDTTEEYEGPSSWTVEGGTLDGDAAWASANNQTNPMTNISHGGGIFRRLRFLNQYANHCIDLCGATGMVIEGCTFEGWLPSKADRLAAPWDGTVWNGTGYPYIEAIQFDHCRAGSGTGGAEDDTVTKGVTIIDCEVKPSADFGPHAVFAGMHGWPATADRWSEILIENNTVQNYLGHALALKYCTDVTVRSNTFISAHDNPRYGALDDGPRAAINVNALGSTKDVERILIENNRIADSGGPDCKFAAISVNEEWWGYTAEASGSYTRVVTAQNMQAKEVRIIDNTITGHQGSYVICAAQNAPAIEITGNRWAEQTVTEGDLFSADMTNVSDNGPIENGGGDSGDGGEGEGDAE